MTTTGRAYTFLRQIFGLPEDTFVDFTTLVHQMGYFIHEAEEPIFLEEKCVGSVVPQANVDVKNNSNFSVQAPLTPDYDPDDYDSKDPYLWNPVGENISGPFYTESEEKPSIYNEDQITIDETAVKKLVPFSKSALLLLAKSLSGALHSSDSTNKYLEEDIPSMAGVKDELMLIEGNYPGSSVTPDCDYVQDNSYSYVKYNSSSDNDPNDYDNKEYPYIINPMDENISDSFSITELEEEPSIIDEDKTPLAFLESALHLADRLPDDFDRIISRNEFSSMANNEVPLENAMSSIDQTIYEVSRGNFRQEDYNKVNWTSEKKTEAEKYIIINKFPLKSSIEVPLGSGIPNIDQTILEVSRGNFRKDVCNKEDLTWVKKSSRAECLRSQGRKRSSNVASSGRSTKCRTTTSDDDSGRKTNNPALIQSTGLGLQNTYNGQVVRRRDHEDDGYDNNGGANSSNDGDNDDEGRGVCCKDQERKETEIREPLDDISKEPSTNEIRDSRPIISNLDRDELLQLSTTFKKYYGIVFDNNVCRLCSAMGHILLFHIEESRRLAESEWEALSTRDKVQLPSGQLNDIKLTLTSRQEVMQQTNSTFVEHFCQVYAQINNELIVGTLSKQLLLIAWFVQVLVTVTLESPDFLCRERIHEVKVHMLELLSDQVEKWPLLCKTFTKRTPQFEVDCWVVLEFIKGYFNKHS